MIESTLIARSTSVIASASVSDTPYTTVSRPTTPVSTKPIPAGVSGTAVSRDAARATKKAPLIPRWTSGSPSAWTTKPRRQAPREPPLRGASKRGVSCERIHGNRSQPQRTQALAGFKSGRYRVLVATDIAARGIDVEALPHVVNFDVPHVPDDYIHRVGRTARAERTGDAFTFVSPEEESDLRAIERALGRRLPRITVPGFDYSAAPAERLEIPIAERIAAIRARKAGDRERAKAKVERRSAAAATGTGAPRRGGPVASGRPPASSAGGGTSWSSHRSRRGSSGRPAARTRPGRP